MTIPTRFKQHCQNWILYQDPDLVIINKPSGLLSVPGKSELNKECVLSYLHQTHPNALVVHRLDMDTSGIMVLANNKLSHRNLSIQFQERNTEKTYVALCQGQCPKDTGYIQLPMRCDWEQRPKQIIDFVHGRHAITRWQLQQQFATHFKINLYPITGRSHQLRVHMKSLGHPILGDVFYADDYSMQQTPRLMLHAANISFDHPTTQKRLYIECDSGF